MKSWSYVFCFFGILLFSTIEIAGKYIGENISPTAITAYRFLLGGLLLFPFALRQWKQLPQKPNGKDWLQMIYPGFLNVAIAMFFLQLSIYYGKASMAAILISSNPIFVAIFAAIILKEKISIPKTIGILVGIVGITLIIGGENSIFQGSRNALLGAIFGLIGSVSFGLYTVLSKKAIRKYGNFLFNHISFTFGSLSLLLIGFLTKQPLVFEYNSQNLLFILYLGLFVTGIAYVFFFEGLKHIPAANGSMFFFLKPVLVTVFSFHLLQERISSTQILGLIMILLSFQLEPLIFWCLRRCKLLPENS